MKHNSNRICDYDFFLDLRRNKEKKERSIIIRASVVVYCIRWRFEYGPYKQLKLIYIYKE